MEKRNKAGGLRASYDRLAGEYAKHLFDELSHKPLDRQLLVRFAQETRGLEPVCDLGCGPGHVTRYLRSLGAEAFGVDLSAGMVAFYSIVHLSREEVPRALGELRRVLRPGGLLLLSFHVGDEIRHLDELWGQEVSLDFYFFRAEDMEGLLGEAGFEVEEVIERPPYGENAEAQTQRAYVFARNPV